uniref:Uncharacterized protein n=2 Tax=Arion vulgaris TaxID=1028688 RepID=A0A0B7B792_9EUPU
MSRKIKYFGHSGLERNVMEGIVPGIHSRGRPRKRWQHDIIETLNMSLGEAGKLARDRVFQACWDECDVLKQTCCYLKVVL